MNTQLWAYPDDMTERAIALAIERHSGQLDKAGDPYILHPLRVMAQFWLSVERQVAVMHDLLEDTPTTVEELAVLGFDPTSCACVAALTRGKDETRPQYEQRVLACGIPLVMRVKIAEIDDNVNPHRQAALSNQHLMAYLKFRTELKVTLSVLEQHADPGH